jgi:hypothetical protein
MDRAGFLLPLAALTLLATITACGSAQRPASASFATASPPQASAGAAASAMDEEVRAPSTAVAPEGLYRTPVRESPTDAPPAAAPPPSVAPTVPATAPARPAPDAAFGFAPARGGGAGDVGVQEELMRRNEASLAAALGECRTICSAAGNICVAAGEVCRLVGADDTRCARARSRCADAGRRRDGACPTCPTIR